MSTRILLYTTPAPYCENANNKVYGQAWISAELQEKNPLMKIALCGCMMQEPEVVENIKSTISL